MITFDEALLHCDFDLENFVGELQEWQSQLEDTEKDNVIYGILDTIYMMVEDNADIRG